MFVNLMYWDADNYAFKFGTRSNDNRVIGGSLGGGFIDYSTNKTNYVQSLFVTPGNTAYRQNWLYVTKNAQIDGTATIDTVSATLSKGNKGEFDAANSGTYSLYGMNTSNTTESIGVKGRAYGGSTGIYYGVLGESNGTNTGTNIGIYGNAVAGTTNWAGYFVGNVYNDGDMTIDHNTTIGDKVIFTQHSTGNVVAGTGITAAMCFHTILYSGDSAIDITANPQIANGTPGQEIMFIGLSDTNTLTFDDGNGLALAGAAQFVLGAGDIIKFVFLDYTGLWTEISRSNN